MTTGNGYDGGSSGRVTLKDVYDIVGGVADKVERLADNVTALTITHEHRLTGLEQRTVAVESKVDSAGKDLASLRTEHDVAKGHIHALAMIGGVVVTAFCGIGGVALAHALHW